ncbi:pilin [Candidatus Saccharibacteria bacterium]|nr:pilin [Candidatus Saccharibacteria bacterium]
MSNIKIAKVHFTIFTVLTLLAGFMSALLVANTAHAAEEGTFAYYEQYWDQGNPETVSRTSCNSWLPGQTHGTKERWATCMVMTYSNTTVEIQESTRGTDMFYQKYWDQGNPGSISYSACNSYLPGQPNENEHQWVGCQKEFFFYGAVTPAPGTSSGRNCGKSFLTFQPWFNHLCVDGAIVSPNDVGGLPTFIWIIVLNILAILLQLVGYLSVGFIIWGGFSYILAQGEPSKISASTRTVVNAVIGLIIAIFANVLINTIVHFIAPGESI